MAEQRSGRFGQIGKTNYALGSDLVKLEIRPGTNYIGEEVPICATVTFGDVDYEGEFDSFFGKTNRLYRIRIRFCKLMYSTIGCYIPEDSKYRYQVQQGAFSYKNKKYSSSDITSTISGSVDTTFKYDSVQAGSGISAIGVKLGKNKNRETSDRTDIEMSSEINLIEPIPNGWTIGIEGRGDPMRAHNQYCLRSCYFDKIVERYPNTCAVRLEDGYDSGVINFRLSVRDGFYIERIDDAVDALSEVSRRDRVRVMNDMRCRIAGLILEKGLEDKLAIAWVSFILERGWLPDEVSS